MRSTVSGAHAAAMAAAVAGTTALAGVALVLSLGWQVLERRSRTERAAPSSGGVERS